MSTFKVFLTILLIAQVKKTLGYKEKGPRFQPTVAEVWPKPKSRINYGDYFEVSENLNFVVSEKYLLKSLIPKMAPYR